MIVQYATKAKAMMAGASHCGHNATKVPLLDPAINGIFAVGRRAPFEIFPVFDVGAR